MTSSTPNQAYCGKALPNPAAYRTRDGPDIQTQIARYGYHVPVSLLQRGQS